MVLFYVECKTNKENILCLTTAKNKLGRRSHRPWLGFVTVIKYMVEYEREREAEFHALYTVMDLKR